MTDPGQPGHPYGGSHPYNPQGNPWGGSPYPQGGSQPPAAHPPYATPSYAAPSYGGDAQSYGGAQPYGDGQPYGGAPAQRYGESHAPYGGESHAPYGSETHAPYGGEPAAPYGTPPPPSKGGGKGKVVGIVVGLLVLLLVICGGLGYVLYNTQKTNTTNAKVNDCVKTDGSLDSTTAQPVNTSKIVSCTAADAQYKVVGIIPGKTEDEFTNDDNVCDAYKASGAKWELWQGSAGKPGEVLCLASAK